MSFAMVPGMTLEQMLRVMGPQPEPPEAPTTAPRRARVSGKFKADDPATPDVNEAWESES
jgi:hypothetical protein